MKSKSKEISIADYNRILLNDAMLWLEAAVNEVREAKAWMIPVIKALFQGGPFIPHGAKRDPSAVLAVVLVDGETTARTADANLLVMCAKPSHRSTAPAETICR